MVTYLMRLGELLFYAPNKNNVFRRVPYYTEFELVQYKI